MQPMDYREEILQKNQLEKHGEQYSVKADNLFQNMHTSSQSKSSLSTCNRQFNSLIQPTYNFFTTGRWRHDQNLLRSEKS